MLYISVVNNHIIYSFKNMHISLSLLLSLTLILPISTSFKLFQEYDNFVNYLEQFGKHYDSMAITMYRFALYRQNLQQIDHLNKIQGCSAVYGLTMFTDWTKQEMKTMLGMKIPSTDKQLHYTTNYTDQKQYKLKEDIPDIWNWVQQGAVTGIKDQGSCGSCWSFSTAGNIEGQYYLRYKQLMDFSEQQMIDCDKSNFGCSGGWPYMAIDWLAKNGGIQASAQYPLRANYSGPCKFNANQTQTKIKGYMNITRNQTVLKEALYNLGPLSIGLDFTGLFHYKSGVACPRFCTTWPDHALVLVGYGTEERDYWLIKNSWGTRWGINGYFMLERGKNKCGVSYWATTALLADQVVNKTVTPTDVETK